MWDSRRGRALAARPSSTSPALGKEWLREEKEKEGGAPDDSSLYFYEEEEDKDCWRRKRVICLSEGRGEGGPKA